MPDDKHRPPSDRRERPRAPLNLPVRFTLADGSEHFGSVSDASAAGLAIIGPDRGAVGETVVAYVNGVGRIDGTIVRHVSGGFAMKLAPASSPAVAKLQRLVEQHRKG